MACSQTAFVHLALAGMAVLSLPPLGAASPLHSHTSQNQTSSNDKSSSPGGMTMEVLSPKDNQDISPYLSKLCIEVKQGWLSVMPVEVHPKKRGIVAVRFSLSRDGKFDTQFPLVVETSSGDKTLDKAAKAAVLSAAPFRKLPKSFSGTRVDLRFTFYYNLPVPSPTTAQMPPH